MLIMWTLSLTILTLATTLWFRDRKVEPGTIGVASGLLFALPAIRNTQAGAPPLGCTADVSRFVTLSSMHHSITLVNDI